MKKEAIGKTAGDRKYSQGRGSVRRNPSALNNLCILEEREQRFLSHGKRCVCGTKPSVNHHTCICHTHSHERDSNVYHATAECKSLNMQCITLFKRRKLILITSQFGTSGLHINANCLAINTHPSSPQSPMPSKHRIYGDASAIYSKYGTDVRTSVGR